MKLSVRQLTYMAFLIALAILLRRILNLRLPYSLGILSFSGFPIILAGFLFGPVAGAVTGGVSDILGYPLFPEGPYLPHFTLTACLTGAIPAIIVNLINPVRNMSSASDKSKRMQTSNGVNKHKSNVPSFWLLTIAIFIGQVITTTILVSYFLQIFFGVPFWVRAPINLISQIIKAPLYAFLSFYIMKIYNNQTAGN